MKESLFLLVRKGNISNALPDFFAGKYGIDLTDEKQYENNYED